MAKQKKAGTTDVQKVEPNLALPSYLQELPIEGVADLGRCIVPPRLKVVQKQAMDELFALGFNIGDLIMSPVNVMVSIMPRVETAPGTFMPGDSSDSLIFTPLFYFSEWCTWNPYEMKGSAPPIIYRTFDPQDPIAIKSRNPAKREEKIGEVVVRHIEHINFMVVLHKPHPMAGETIILSFSRGEFMTGSKFATLLKMRRAAIYTTKFSMHVAKRDRGGFQWYGIDVTNPDPDSSSPYIDEAQLAPFQEKYNEYARLHSQALIRPDYEDPEASDGTGETGEY